MRLDFSGFGSGLRYGTRTWPRLLHVDSRGWARNPRGPKAFRSLGGRSIAMIEVATLLARFMLRPLIPSRSV